MLLLVGCGTPAEEDAPVKDEETSSSQQGGEPVVDNQSTEGQSWTSAISKMGNVEVGKPAPSFTLKDEEGTEWSLADYKGSVVMLDFWAFW